MLSAFTFGSGDKRRPVYRAMYSQPVKSLMERRKLLKGKPNITVRKASVMMAKKNVGAILLLEGEALLGILTERDITFRTVAAGLDPEITQAREVMTPQPITISPLETYGYALLLMHEHGFRHLPVVDNGKVVGIVSARNALDPDLEEFVSETRRRVALRSQPARI
jgi:CBS domain-containing protein